MFVPAELGGRPVDLATFIQALEIVASADGPNGWELGTSLGCCRAALTLPGTGLDRVFGRGPVIV
jgi:hypothetical protein